MAPPEVVGDGLGVVGVGDGLGLVCVGDGLGVVGVGDGLGEFTGGVLGEAQADGDADALLCCAVAPGLGNVVPRWVGVFDPRSVEPAPLGLPLVPPWLEVVPLGGLSFSRPMNVPRIPPSAKAPTTTSTTAPATARAGRSQAMAGPADLCGRRPVAQAVMPPRTDRSDRGRLPGAAPGLAAASGAVPAPGALLEPAVRSAAALAVLRKASQRTTTSQRSTMSSLRSNHHCRLSHGSVSRARIFVKPSPTGSI